MDDDLIVQRPEGTPGQLVLLFHGVGGSPESMRPLAQRLAEAFPQSMVVCVRAPHVSDSGSGYQWFSVAGISESTRPARVAGAAQAFVQAVRRWQEASGASVDRTALIGFSQGAIMALESMGLEADALAGRIVALAGRYAGEPHPVPAHTTLHMIHGKQDGVIPYSHTILAAEKLLAAGADVTADVMPFVGHEISAEVADLVLERLQGYVPKRVWEEALRTLPPEP